MKYLVLWKIKGLREYCFFFFFFFFTLHKRNPNEIRIGMKILLVYQIKVIKQAYLSLENSILSNTVKIEDGYLIGIKEKLLRNEILFQ